jgi:hypothetical protein
LDGELETIELSTGTKGARASSKAPDGIPVTGTVDRIVINLQTGKLMVHAATPDDKDACMFCPDKTICVDADRLVPKCLVPCG